MSDAIKHECGIAFLRLLKPLSYYKEKYGDVFYGLHKMYLLMEKQHNRGQDGAGLVSVKIDSPPGVPYYDRERSVAANAIKEIYEVVFDKINAFGDKIIQNADDAYIMNHIPFTGDLLLGHLRYGTHGNNSKSNCHPRIRANNWKTRTLMVAGNFNLTNVDELFEHLVQLGQFPKEVSDTMTVLEKIGHFLDTENQRLFKQYKYLGLDNRDITKEIASNLNFHNILHPSAQDFDGGYVMAGIIGHGDAFVMRDPNGIRPAYYYHDEEIVVVASERPAIQTTFNVHRDRIIELEPATAITVRKDGTVRIIPTVEKREKKSCSFERIYFSRGSDFEIYRERKELGRLLTQKILEAVAYDMENTVFSYIPNTAEVAFYGMVDELRKSFIRRQIKYLKDNNIVDADVVEKHLTQTPRIEKIAIKDVKLRTFITEDNARNDLVHHVYDVTYGIIHNNKDTIVVMDDSIVRGTTLKESILTMLDRLQPKKIIIVSSAPQIRYPDCYGIDMSKIGNFVVFQAAVQLIKEVMPSSYLEEIYKECKSELLKGDSEINNPVKKVYSPFSDEQLLQKISSIVKPNHIFSDVQIIFQSVEALHVACPNHLGDWYFTGNYPTAGGVRSCIRSFINFYEGKNTRSY
jgi:amidophosphoribosyltransferase